MLHPVSPNFSLSLVTEDKRVRGFGVSTDSIPTWVLKIKKSLNKQDPVTLYLVCPKLHGNAVIGKKFQEKHHDLCDISALRFITALENYSVLLTFIYEEPSNFGNMLCLYYIRQLCF